MLDDLDPSAEIAERISAAYGIDRSLSDRVVEEVLHYSAETVEEWVRSTHIRLQRRGMRNEDIYASILVALPERRFAAPSLSLRQIRRLIYG